jgi:hypothetical protein
MKSAVFNDVTMREERGMDEGWMRMDGWMDEAG